MEDEALIRITPDKAIETLRKDEINVNMEEAQIILDFFYSMANIVVGQYMSDRHSDVSTVAQKGK